MLLEISGEITPERKKGLSQSKTNVTYDISIKWYSIWYLKFMLDKKIH